MLTRREFLKLTAVTAISALGGVFYTTHLEPAWVQVESVPLNLPRLHPAFHGTRLVHISDIHFDDEWMTAARLRDLVERINTLAAHAILITGDFVTKGKHAANPQWGEILSGLRAPWGVFATLGNHDYWSDDSLVRRALQKAQIHLLDNKVHTIQRSDAALHLCGVDDIWEKQHRLSRVLADLPQNGAAVLLAHEPDFADESAAANRFDLQLSGHAHGGQVYLPGYGAPILPPLGKKYPVGLYKVGTMWQYSTRGLGMVKPFVRLNCRPEITLLTLHAA